MGTTTDKTTYLNNTKLKIKDGINRLGGELTNLSTFRSYAQALDNIYNTLPKVTGTGSDLSLTPTLKGGLNILPLGNAEQDTIAYVDVGTLEEGNIDGTTGQNTSLYGGIRTADYIKVKPNVLYNITRTIATSYMVFRFYDSNKQYLGHQTTEGMITTDKTQNRMQQNETSMTMTIINTNVAYMRLADDSSNLSTIYTISTQAPTPDYPQDVKVVTGDNQVVVCNKNLLPFNNQDFTIGNIHFWVNNGSLYANGTSVGEISPKNTIFKDNFTFILGAGTYTITGNNALASYIMKYDDDSFILTSPNYVGDTPRTFTLAERTKLYLGFYIYQRNLSNINLKNIIEKGSTATSYIAHAEQSTTLHLGDIKLNGIGNYIDLPFKDGDTWKIRRKVGKVVLNGSESGWGISNTGTPNWYYRLSISLGANNTYNSLFKSNNYSYADIGNNNTNQGFIVLGAYIRFRYGTEDTIENYKTWLNTHNTVIYYILAEQTEETITDTTLINELNELQDLLSYDGTTNITITSDSSNAQMLVQASALKGE